MPRKKIWEEKAQFNTPINAQVLDNFKAKCKEQGIKQNLVIEAFMKQYIAGEFSIKVIKENENYLDVIADDNEEKFLWAE